MKNIIPLLAATALATIAVAIFAPVQSHAATAPTAWVDSPGSGKPAQLEAIVMGDWCYLRTENGEGKSVRFYSRKNKCNEWMTVGPTSYRAPNRSCEAMKMGFGE